jgi:hypothetical protein
LNQRLRQRGLTEQQIGSLVAERRLLDERISTYLAQKESLEKELGQKRKALSEAKKELNKIQSNKTKIDLPTVAGIDISWRKVKRCGLQRGYGKSGTFV